MVSSKTTVFECFRTYGSDIGRHFDIMFKSSIIAQEIMFIEELQNIRERIRSYLDKHTYSERFEPQVEAARYVLLNESAKLWRPLLTIAVARDYGADLKNSSPISPVVEFVHAASLIEDDISDKSVLRRGKNSCHIEFGEDLAHLAQMYLVQKAYNLILNERGSLNLRDEQKISILKIASESGINMISGQTKDVKQIDIGNIEDILRMYEEKSGSLIGLSLACGGIIGGASSVDVKILRKLGIAVGVSYQIVDDVLDNFASNIETGKPERQDDGKKTLLKLVGLEKVKELKCSKDREIRSYLGRLSVTPLCLNEMAIYLPEF